MNRSKRRHKPGQGIVEFALVAPWFFLILLGVMELGRLVWIDHELANGSREGARYAMVRGSQWAKTNSPITNDNVKTQILSKTTGISGASLNVTTTGLGGAPTTQLTVTSSYKYKPLFGIIPKLSNLTLSHSSKVIIQH